MATDGKKVATLPELLNILVASEGSDLHITTDTPPQIRVHGHLRRLDGGDMTPAVTKQLTYSVLTDSQKKRFEETLELDFSFGIKGLARFRCNMFNQRGAVGAVYRLIPEKIRSFQELGLPQVLATLSERPRGRSERVASTGGRPSSWKLRIFSGISRYTAPTAPRWLNMLQRKRASPLMPNEKSSSSVSSKRFFCESVSTL